MLLVPQYKLHAPAGEPFEPVLLFFADHSSAHRLALDLAVETGRLFVRVWLGLALSTKEMQATLRENCSTVASDS